jgi:major membrane immunogen (membrane-anchored lipoprotein)
MERVFSFRNRFTDFSKHYSKTEGKIVNRTWLAVVVVALILAGAWYLNNQRGGAVSYRDGTYEGKSATDERGNYGTIEIRVQDGKITAVDYVEYGGDGKPKGPEYPWQQALEAIPEYEKQLIDKQNPDKVDTISEATGTGEKFREAAKDALKKAAG